MSEQFQSIRFSIPVPMFFVNLHEPKPPKLPNGQTGTPKYGANFLMEPDSADLKAIKDYTINMFKQHWPGWDPKMLGKPWESGDARADHRLKTSNKKDGDFQRGKVVVVARSQNQPQLATLINGVYTEYEDPIAINKAKPKFYSGVKALAQITLAPYGMDLQADKPGNRGVTAYLDAVMSTGEGDKIGGQGRVDMREAFKHYQGAASGVNPLNNADDPYGDI